MSTPPFDVEKMREVLLGTNGWAAHSSLAREECLECLDEIDRLRAEVDFWKSQTDEWEKLRDRLRTQLAQADKLAEAAEARNAPRHKSALCSRHGARQCLDCLESALVDYRALRPAAKEKT